MSIKNRINALLEGDPAFKARAQLVGDVYPDALKQVQSLIDAALKQLEEADGILADIGEDTHIMRAARSALGKRRMHLTKAISELKEF